MKSLVTSLLLFLFIPVCGQQPVHDSLKVYYQDSLMISKDFKEGSLSNTLTVKVINPCNAEKEKFDGAVTIISAAVKNKNYSNSIVYNYPYAQSGLINVKEDHISIYTVNKQKAVLIPFTYCGNWDNDTKVSYIILYNRKKYLYHIKYYCEEGGKCKIKDNLNITLKDLPPKLKLQVIKDLKTKYNKSKDFY
ncbi:MULTISPECIES: hypothetical protein [unclassified Chryseobacterium]|uniref:hypothetical protein n=1 Tax=unclassified Chryseobacterium TaxID=2593645 RepID=UPI00100AEF6F|nr:MULTISPECIES: hypothetical protein [unclassified Chryseobacterium]RXM50573.1 hypothetical protein BOQ64_17680 [Chryseobacterium sp. CH25]RXM63208.1 hypothetical protein BOQ60_17880 [Chryseobacterium sp. CH1]